MPVRTKFLTLSSNYFKNLRPDKAVNRLPLLSMEHSRGYGDNNGFVLAAGWDGHQMEVTLAVTDGANGGGTVHNASNGIPVILERRNNRSVSL